MVGMKKIVIGLVWMVGGLWVAAQVPEGEDWVEVRERWPLLQLELRYATDDNFTDIPLYACGRCYLRRPTAEALYRALEELEQYGYGLKLWDCYRPSAVQARLWHFMPDKRYVAPPYQGSMHNRGMAVDLTLVDLEGREVDMGTDFDDFSPRAHTDARGLSEDVRCHRALLKRVMEQAGFRSIKTEWWHYSLVSDTTYPISRWMWPCPKGR